MSDQFLECAGPLPSTLEVSPVYWAILALWAFAVTGAWLWYSVFSGNTTVTKILFAVGIYCVSNTLFCSIMGALYWAVGKLQLRFVMRSDAHKEQVNRIFVSTWIVLQLGLLVFLIFFMEKVELPFAGIIAFWALSSLGIGIFMILGKNMKSAVTMITVPRRLRCWIDLYASADPVPNGPTITAQSESGGSEFRSIPIWNQGSFFADHTTYWDNVDGFVLRVVRACVETAESEWKDLLPPDTPEVDKRAEWRVGWLRLAHWAAGLSWLLIGVSLWFWHRKDIPLPFKLPDWLPANAVTTARLAVLVAAITILAWGSLRILRSFWGIWVRGEQKKWLTQQRLGGGEFLPLTCISMAVGSIFCLAIPAVTDDPCLLTDYGTLGSGLMGTLSFSFLFTWALLKAKPGPQFAQPNPEVGQESQPTSPGSPHS